MPKPSNNQQSHTTAQLLAVAACSMVLSTGSELQLLPAGTFSARDGRPADAPGWHLDAELAQALVAAANARGTPYVIDYEHQTMLAKQNGQPAPAAGWFTKVEWREGTGLYAIDVEWTARAREMIDANEYRFVSPVIGYDKSGAVTALYMAAITNNPAIDGMDEVLLAAASMHFNLPITPTTPLTQEIPMEELLEQLRWMLNLPVGSTANDIQAHLTKLIDLIKQDPTATAAASFDLPAMIANQRTQIASLTSTTPDPAKFVPIETVTTLQGQLATLSAELNGGRVDDIVKKAVADGKLLPVQETWARSFGAKDIAALSAFIENAPPIALLSGTQTNGIPPKDAPQTTVLTENQVALCAALGVSQEDFLKTSQAEKRA
jgi:phage I-like protein